MLVRRFGLHIRYKAGYESAHQGSNKSNDFNALRRGSSSPLDRTKKSPSPSDTCGGSRKAPCRYKGVALSALTLPSIGLPTLRWVRRLAYALTVRLYLWRAIAGSEGV
jgi:hypothetical protein